MKLSKMRKKARSAFNMRKRVVDLIQLNDPHRVPVPTVFMRGRSFTKPQCAVQRDR